jgi:hypothetical protein
LQHVLIAHSGEACKVCTIAAINRTPATNLLDPSIQLAVNLMNIWLGSAVLKFNLNVPRGQTVYQVVHMARCDRRIYIEQRNFSLPPEYVRTIAI